MDIHTFFTPRGSDLVTLIRNKTLPIQDRRKHLIELLSKTHPNIDTSKLGWDGIMKSKVTGLKCREHPETCRWNTHPPYLNNLILHKSNCPQCAAAAAAAATRKPFEHESITRHPPLLGTLAVNPDAVSRFDYNKCIFKNMKTRVYGIKCIECNLEFDCRPEEHLISRHGCCPGCMRIATSGENHHGHVSLDELKDRIRRFHGGDGEWLKDGEWEYLEGGLFKYDFTGYVRLSDYIKIYCPSCDRAWSASATNHVHPGTGDGDISAARRCVTCSGSKGEKTWLGSWNNPNIVTNPQHRIVLESEAHRIATGRGYLQVDGYDPTTRTVYEFLGCLWHGCSHFETCRPYHKPFADEYVNPMNKKSMVFLRNEWYARKSVLEELGYRVVYIWECEWRNSPQSVTLPTTP